MHNDPEYERALMLRQTMAVKRYHILRTLRTQTTGEHSGAVAVLIMQCVPDCSAALLKAALAHDFHERATGDMPSTAKMLYPELGVAMNAAAHAWEVKNGFAEMLGDDLTVWEQDALKYFDYLELLLWSLEEIKLGNSYAAEAVIAITPALLRMSPPTTRAENVLAGALNAARACGGALAYLGTGKSEFTSRN